MLLRGVVLYEPMRHHTAVIVDSIPSQWSEINPCRANKNPIGTFLKDLAKAKENMLTVSWTYYFIRNFKWLAISRDPKLAHVERQQIPETLTCVRTYVHYVEILLLKSCQPSENPYEIISLVGGQHLFLESGHIL